MADPPELHGPDHQWTRKVRQKTVGRWLNKEQRDDYQVWIDNRRRIRELLNRLEAISEQVLRQILAGSAEDPNHLCAHQQSVGKVRFFRGWL